MKIIVDADDNDSFIPEGASEAYFPHTESNPFCSDPTCGCHEDAELIAEVNDDYQEGLLSSDDATRIVNGQTI